MDVAQTLSTGQTTHAIKCIDMHTTGEPTRVIYSGFPELKGTLLEQREQAMNQHDDIRRRIMLEPRGHNAMYGAIIRPKTELVDSGEAHVGVLFTHNGGFSTMCGHATIALGRFLVDTHDLAVFPRRGELVVNDDASNTVDLKLHAPCGVVRVQVPVTSDGQRSDPTRPVRFLSTPAFATGIQIQIPISREIRWPELGERESITLDVSYGGAFYAIVSAQELGFAQGLKDIDLDAATRCIQKLKPYLSTRPEIISAVQHPQDSRLSFLYSVMITDSTVGAASQNGGSGVETGLCYFADNQIDRSPTGSCVSARMALAHAKGLRGIGQRWMYNSLVSNSFGEGMFDAAITEEVDIEGGKGVSAKRVVVAVEGQAFYTGTSTFVAEDGDAIGGSGFSLNHL